MAAASRLPGFLIEHPASEGETYGEHFAVAMGFSRQLLKASACAALHAVLPSLHKTSASQAIHRLNHCIETGDREAIALNTRAFRATAPTRQAKALNAPQVA